jgi:hypothetical protein
MPSTTTSRLEGMTTSVAVKAPCRLKTTAQHPLAGLAAIDGVIPGERDRILVAANSDARENGIWLAQSGAWTRATDFDGSLDVVCGTTVFVHSGTGQGGTFWRVTTPDQIAIGVSEIDWARAPVAHVLSDGAVSLEQFGGLGYLTSAAAKTGFDNRTAIQAAIDTLAALGGGTIILHKPYYGFAASARPLATPDITTGTTGVGIVIDGAHITFKSTCGGTRLYRRARGMADPAAWANWPLLSGGGGWRGGGVFLKGKAAQPTDFSTRSGITLDGVTLDGGITKSVSNTYSTVTGDGWDVTDKGIWSDNAVVEIGTGVSTTGDIRIINGGGIIGYRGELVYGPNNTDCTMYIRNGVFGETNGQCINPNSCQLDVDGLYGYNANMCFEGWGGKRGRLLNARFKDCSGNGGSLAGGKFGAGTFSPFYAPTRVTAGEAPYCEVDLEFRNCAAFRPGSWLRGRVTLIDSQMIFENAAFQDGIIDTHFSEVICITDQSSGAGITFAGGDGSYSANQSIQDIKIDKLSFQRTKVARAASRFPGAPVGWYASLGPGIVIGELQGEMLGPPRDQSVSSGNAINFLNTDIQSISGFGSASQNVQTTPALQSVANTWHGPLVQTTTTGAGIYGMTLPTAGFIQGSELNLFNSGPGQVYLNGNILSGAGFRNKVGPVWLPLASTTKFKFDGNFWTHISGGSHTATTTVGNLPTASADWQSIRLFVTDSNATLTAGIGAVVAGGGANKVPVTCDGTNWRIG